jgi:DNA-binding NtrC family response regulator
MNNIQKNSLLFVEDTPSIVETLVPILEEEGFEVVSVANGYDAIIEMKKKFFDVVISDYKLPDISGDVLLKTIHEMNPSSSIILTSGFDNVGDDIKSGAGNGLAIDFLEKPINLEKLFATLQKARSSKQKAV